MPPPPDHVGRVRSPLSAQRIVSDESHGVLDERGEIAEHEIRSGAETGIPFSAQIGPRIGCQDGSSLASLESKELLNQICQQHQVTAQEAGMDAFLKLFNERYVLVQCDLDP